MSKVDIDRLGACKMFTWYLAGNSAPYFSLGILEQLDERRDKVASNNFLVDRFSNLHADLVESTTKACPVAYLFELVGDHIAYSPALVLEQTPERGKKHTMA